MRALTSIQTNPRICCRHRVDPVSEQPKSVHPIGQRIKASTKMGFSLLFAEGWLEFGPSVEDIDPPAIGGVRYDERVRACPVSRSSPRRSPLRVKRPPAVKATHGVSHCTALVRRSMPPSPCSPGPLVSDVRGVGHFRTASVNVSPLWRGLASGDRPAVEFAEARLSDAVAVGHDDDPLASMAVTGFVRAEYSCLNAVAQLFQWRDDGSELSRSVPCDVLSEETERPALANDADDLVDEKPFVIAAAHLSGLAIRLAGIAGSDAMNASTPRSSVEGGKVRPDRRRSQVTRFHAVDQLRGGRCFPLHVSDATRSGHGEFDTESESSGSGAQFDDVPGTYSHVIPRPH